MCTELKKRWQRRRTVSAELMPAGRADNAALPQNAGGEEGRDARGRESKAGGRGNPGTHAQGWWGSPQH